MTSTAESLIALVRQGAETPRPAGYKAPPSPERSTAPVGLDTLARVRPSNSITEPEDNPEEPDEDPAPVGPAVWTEVSRTVSVVRVENQEDPEQYVDVERIETLLMEGPDGSRVEWRLNHG